MFTISHNIFNSEHSLNLMFFWEIKEHGRQSVISLVLIMQFFRWKCTPTKLAWSDSAEIPVSYLPFSSTQQARWSVDTQRESIMHGCVCVCTQESFNTGADFVSGVVLGNGFIAVSMRNYGSCLSRIYILAMERKNFSIQISISKTSCILPEILEKSKSTV